MKAAILTALNQPLVVDNIDMPALDVGQVLVTVQYASICGAQLGEIAGKKGPDKYLPHLLGHEGVGTVREIGPGVTTKAVGDRVILHWRPSEGIAAKGAIYDWHGTPVNSGPMTCFAEQTIVSENRLTLLPDGIDARVAPLFGCALTTAVAGWGWRACRWRRWSMRGRSRCGIRCRPRWRRPGRVGPIRSAFRSFNTTSSSTRRACPP